MLDKVFAIIGMAGLVAFMAVVTTFIMEPDLWIITLVVLGIGIKFIWQELSAGGSHLERDGQSGSDG